MEMILYLFLFILESISCILVFLFIFHASITHSRIRRCIGILIILSWVILILTRYEPCPYIVAIFLCTLLLFSEKWYLMICWYTTYSLILFIFSTCPALFIFTIVNHTLDFRLITRSTSYALLLCVIILCYIMRNKTITFSQFLHTLSFKESFLISGVCFFNFLLSAIFSILFIDTAINAWGQQLALFSMIAIVLVSILILFFYFQLKKNHFILQQNDAMNRMLLQQEKKYYLDLQKNNMDLRAFRHDYNQHLLALHELASVEENSAVYQYVNSLLDFHKKTKIISTNNHVADAVLNYFYSIKEKDTIFDVNGKLGNDLFISDNDLCVLLSNLLKNATAALENAPEDAGQKIMVTLFSNYEYLSIQVINSSMEYSEWELEEIKTTRRTSKYHGFGIPNILAVLQKHQGIIDLSYADGYFTANIYIRNILRKD